MVKVSGIVPTILYNEIEGNEDLVAKGSDLDIKAAKGGRVTSLSAITVGNGKWEIYEMDDAADLFPEYDEGDILSLDVLKKVLNQGVEVSQSRQVFSFNLLGKIKYGLKDAGEAVDEKAGKIQKGLGKVKNWFTDELDKETAQEYLRQYYPGANVGKIDLTMNQDGKYYKVLFGVPSEGKFYILTMYRNGNDIRTLDDDDNPDTPIISYEDGNAALEAYEKYPNIEGIGNGEDGYEFTEESFKPFVNENNQLLDFEQIEDDGYKIDGLPTAVSIMMYKAEENGGGFHVGNWTYKDGNLVTETQRSFSFNNKESAEMMLDEAISFYAELGGKKDLSYLYEALGLAGGEQSQQEETQQEEAPTSGTTEDGIEWEISAAFKKRRKSKYNGKNVTGYDEGMFEMAEAPAVASSRKVFSKLLCQRILANNYVPLHKTVSKDDFQGSAYVNALENLGFKVPEYGKITGSSKYDLYILFSEDNESIGRVHFKDKEGKWDANYRGKWYSGTTSDEFSRLLGQN